MTLAKPVMRGLLTAQIKKNLIVATGLSVITVFTWKVFFQAPRKQAYADFYKYVTLKGCICMSADFWVLYLY